MENLNTLNPLYKGEVMARLNKLCLIFFAVVVVFLLSFPSFSQAEEQNVTVDPILMKKLEYRLVGPSRGGRVTAVTGIPDLPFTFYMGTTGGGVWKTTDGGITWENISDKFFQVGSIGSVEVAREAYSPSKSMSMNAPGKVSVISMMTLLTRKARDRLAAA